MAKAKMGARVRFCGHVNAWFVADIWELEGVNVVVANGDLKQHLVRDAITYQVCTHHLHDFPKAGYWKESRGIFVVPKDQVKELKR
jgi:hypothetical protein